MLARAGWIALLVLLPALAGCAQPEVESAGANEGATIASPPRATAVVADIGPGVNPYHEAFRRPTWTEHPSTRIPGFPQDAPALNLTLGDDYAANVEADEAVWATVEENVTYWVPGTNLLLLTTRTPSWEGVVAGRSDKGSHGVGSSGAMAAACPECYVLHVQDGRSLDAVPLRRIAEEMPWVDFVASTNVPGDPGFPPFSKREYADASRALADSGRLFFGFTSNTVVTGTWPSPVYPFAFAQVGMPPWVVSVGGVHSRCSASDVLAGKPPEMVGDMTQRLPLAGTIDGYGYMTGVSFATPQVAGSFGHALVHVRAAMGDTRAPGALWAGAPAGGALEDGVLTAVEMRAAFNQTARWFSPTDYVPGECGSAGPMTALPVSATPWAEMGWGYAGMEEANLTAQALLGDASLPAKPDEAEAFMGAWLAARRQLFP